MLTCTLLFIKVPVILHRTDVFAAQGEEVEVSGIERSAWAWDDGGEERRCLMFVFLFPLPEKYLF